MVITGRYQHVENVNLFELMKRGGYTDEEASAADKSEAIVTVASEGDKVSIKLEGFGEVLENHFVLGQESEEKLLKGSTTMTTVTKEGDALKLVSKGDVKIPNRLYKFTDSGFEAFSELDGFEAKRIYKRI